MESIAALDTQVFFFLNGLHTTWLDPIMYYLTNTLTSLPVYILIIYLLFKKFRSKIWIPLICIIACIALTDQITSGIMKPAFARLRPTHEPLLAEKVHTVNNYKGGRFGFASSHASNTSGIAMFTFLLFRNQYRTIGLLFIWAGLISYTRIYLGVHYPGDILVGAGIGLVCGLILSKIFKAVSQRLAITNTK
ncbi:MAG: phosphatase PAP2 family protein [Cyclobacteriaceae bacterium]|nr:phosphatase PAP2 family protein [Cyclobacteriaceae bacterium]